MLSLTYFVYNIIKGLKGDDLKSEILKRINEVQLGPKTNALASALSGGMKRKLCLAIAFMGKSKVIFLGELFSYQLS